LSLQNESGEVMSDLAKRKVSCAAESVAHSRVTDAVRSTA
jgi:hypothetical protein